MRTVEEVYTNLGGVIESGEFLDALDLIDKRLDVDLETFINSLIETLEFNNKLPSRSTCNEQCGQVLQLRQNKNSLMSPEDLSKLIAITSRTLTEKISPCFEAWKGGQSGEAQKSAGEMTGVPGGSNLSAIVLQQAKLAVEEIHQANVAQANLLLEREKWERCDVPQNFDNRVLSKLMPSNSDIHSDIVSDESQSKETATRGRRYLALPEDRGSFLVVPAGLGILELVAVYLDVARALPQLVTDVAVRLTSMLRLANSQIEKLLLEGQAVSSGSRKTVTATNLALTYQTIDMLSSVLPLVAKTLESISGPDGGPGIRIVLEDILYRLTAEMSEHKANLMRKLGDILVERFDHHCAKWLSAERAGRCKDRKGANENVVKIINDVSSMHRVLMKSLSPKCVGLIFSRVFVDFSSRFEVRLVKEKKKVDDADILGSWRTSILADLSQIVIKLRPIEDIKDNMEASVKEMLQVVDRILPPEEGGATSADLLKLLQHTSEQAEVETDSGKSESKSPDESLNVTE
ncbi:Vacuolar protein sorting-associated protein 54 [Perkinsus chesapeaki]|uniref:Vacuolar protein sorting-associated protein 54 n=1 Tax=Perkinsus chesapeaki TaxID=330153 RepID=A0A7J6M2M0_PERCH|nr:Vacuolar protein sorting-associated protein 54 [Perkinsus chesapeaki]